MSTFEVLIIGSSSALPAYGRHPAAQLVNIHENYLLLDCGEGTQSRLIEYGQKPHRIQHIFISHLHGDHYFGLPGFLTSINLLGRKDPLAIYCPPGLEDLILDIIKIGQGELQYKINWTTLSHTGMKKITDATDFEVFAFPLKHRIPTYAFLIAEKAGLRNMKPEMLAGIKLSPELIKALKRGENIQDGSGKVYLSEEYTVQPSIPRRYAYVTDTLFAPSIIPYLKGVDLLYHESTYMVDLGDKALTNFHSTARQAAEIAQQAQVKNLILGHFSSRYKTLDGLLNEALTIFPRTALGLEGARFNV